VLQVTSKKGDNSHDKYELQERDRFRDGKIPWRQDKDARGKKILCQDTSFRDTRKRGGRRDKITPEREKACPEEKYPRTTGRGKESVGLSGRKSTKKHRPPSSRRPKRVGKSRSFTNWGKIWRSAERRAKENGGPE